MNTRALGAPRRHIVSRPTTRLLTALVTASLLTLGAGAASAPAAAGPVAPATVGVSTALVGRVITVSPDTYERRVHRLVNLRRESLGLRGLRRSACAQGTAERWASHLAVTDAFYHQSMSAVLDACDASYAGETLGRGTMSPRQLIRMWMQSAGHRAILLTPKARRLGIGASQDADGGFVVAANFVRP